MVCVNRLWLVHVVCSQAVLSIPIAQVASSLAPKIWSSRQPPFGVSIFRGPFSWWMWTGPFSRCQRELLVAFPLVRTWVLRTGQNTNFTYICRQTWNRLWISFYILLVKIFSFLQIDDWLSRCDAIKSMQMTCIRVLRRCAGSWPPSKCHGQRQQPCTVSRRRGRKQK